MNVACLAWGSLVWDSRGLPIRRQWFKDGPFGQVEFARKSKDDRITLTLCAGAAAVRLLWAQMDPTDPETAREALKLREELTAKDWKKDIGCWRREEAEPDLIQGLGAWAEARGIEAVVWTALKPKFKANTLPTEDTVIAHLAGLTGTRRDNAEQYVRRTPPQVDTKYRRRIEAEFGWVYDPLWRPPGA